MITGPILLVEDDENDVLLFRRAAEKSGVGVAIQIVRDGQEATDYLRGVDPFSERARHPFPALVVLDLNLPHKHGFEVLKWIRQTPACITLPVIVLSSSNSELDITVAFRLGANSYFVKRGDPDQLAEMVGLIWQHWFVWGQIPPDSRD